MSLPTSLLSYQDCTELLSSALEDDFGIRIRVDDYDAAQHERMRIHQCRKLHRARNAEIHEPGEAMHGRSEYDAIVVRIKRQGDDFYLYLERNDKVRGEIESLSELENAEGGEIEPQGETETEAKTFTEEEVVKKIDGVQRRV